MGIFDKFKSGLGKSSSSLTDGFKNIFSKKKIGYVHLLSIITQVGIAIGTAALVLVLSVFNGFENSCFDLNNSPICLGNSLSYFLSIELIGE